MADRYWVGGTGTWDASDTSHWSATDGGASGASVPVQPTDDVYFTAASGGGTVTLGASVECHAVTTTGFTGVIDGQNLYTITLRGTTNCNFLFSSGMTASGLSIGWGSGANGSLTSAGRTLRTMTVGGGSGSAVVTLNDALALTTSLILTSGTLDLNDQAVTALNLNTSTTPTRTLDMGASVITLTGNSPWNTSNSTGLTIIPGTSVINFTHGFPNPVFGTVTLNDIHFTALQTGNPSGTISGAFTCRNLTFTPAVLQRAWLAIQNTITCTGTFAVAGTSPQQTVLIASSSETTARTISAANVSLSYAYFRDIAATGAATWSGTAVGDCLGNTGFTFAAPVTRYWVGGTGSYADTAEWSATSGGASGASVPLPQDIPIFDENSFSANGQTVTFNVYQIGAIDATAVNRTGILFSLITTTNFHKGITSSANVLFTGNVAMTMRGRSAHTLGGCNFQTPYPSMGLTAHGGSYTLTSDIGAGASNRLGSVAVGAGTLDLAGFTAWIYNLSSTGSTTRAITFNGGTFMCRDNVTSNLWQVTATGLTMSAADGTIEQNAAIPGGVTLSFIGGGFTYGKLRHTAAGSTGSLVITDSNSFADIEFSDTANARTLTLAAGTTTTLRSPRPLQSFRGTVGKQMSLVSGTPGSPATVAIPNGYGGGTDQLFVKDILASAGPIYAGRNSTDGTGNTNVIFDDPVSDDMLAMF